MNNIKLIETFYTAFAHADIDKMLSCYHDEIEFTDPVFGKLNGMDAKNMWRMLLSNNKTKIEISYSNVDCKNEFGKANWVATYYFSQTGNKVVNRISANFEFKDDKIIKHRDYFNMWNWSRQALGFTGLLLGWTPLLKNKIRNMASKNLARFIKNS